MPVWVVENLAPLVCKNRVFVDIFEDLDLVSSTIHVESIFVADKSVICPCLWNLIHGWRASTIRVPICGNRRGDLRSRRLLKRAICRYLFIACHLHIISCAWVWLLPNFVPLLFVDFVLKQIIEISATFPSVSSEKVQTIPVRYSSGTRPGLWLVIY